MRFLCRKYLNDVENHKPLILSFKKGRFSLAVAKRVPNEISQIQKTKKWNTWQSVETWEVKTKPR
jgi:hypothetical protein